MLVWEPPPNPPTPSPASGRGCPLVVKETGLLGTGSPGGHGKSRAKGKSGSDRRNASWSRGAG
jgi:hypothetical protein